jgi:ribose transport system permease protein
VFRIDSFIATLGVSSVLGAVTDWVSGNQQILNLGSGFSGLATRSVGGITLPVWFMLFVAVAIWYVLERTPIGRRVYATGGNPEAARLAGVRTPLVVAASLGVCGLLAASAGVLQSSSTAAGDPTIGPGFLLPAFAAAFLGSTQFKAGRYNVWGTVIAVYVLATGVTGLQLSGAPVWIPQLFDGGALLLAVGMASRQGGPNPLDALRRVRLRRPAPGAPAVSPADVPEETSVPA